MLRALVVVVGALSLLALPAAAQDREMVLETDTGETTVQVWQAKGDGPRAVILFGHGWGGSPVGYAKLFEAWSDAGYSIYAPITLDSSNHPGNSALDMGSMAAAQAVIGDRMVATMALRQRLEDHHGDVPVVLAGHSFGSFVAFTQAEGKWAFGPLAGPEVDAVLAFSSPGNVPMLVGPDSYSALDLPMMMVTGTNDVGGETFPNWEAHRLAFDRKVEGDSYLVVVDEGGHNMISFDDESLLEPVAKLSLHFLNAYAGADEAAKEALAGPIEMDRITIERR